MKTASLQGYQCLLFASTILDLEDFIEWIDKTAHWVHINYTPQPQTVLGRVNCFLINIESTLIKYHDVGKAGFWPGFCNFNVST